MYKIYTEKWCKLSGYAKQFFRIMKIMIIIMTACLMQVTAATFAQKITLNEENASLISVFKKISKQTGIDFMITGEVLAEAKKVTINVKAEELSLVLKQIFEGQPLNYLLKDKAVMVSHKSLAPEKISGKNVADTLLFKGTILDDKGLPLPRASIKVKGISKATLTSNEGSFYIYAPVNGVLQVSYIGFVTQEITLKRADADGVMKIKLSTVNSDLSQVSIVSTGYQELPKERATGSFEKIDNKLFNRVVSTDVLSRLDGITTGVQFKTRTALANGKSPINNIMIRGISSFNNQPGEGKPLVILDNMSYDGELNNINPNDVESITLLKDAAASSIWGARAGSGVIVITTKKGAFEQPIKVSLNTNLTISEKPDLFYMRRISTPDFIDVERFLFNQGFYNSKINNQSTFPFLTPVVELLAKQRALDVNDIEGRTLIDQQIETLKQYDVRDDYLKYVYRNATNQQYALNLNGGSKNVSYLFSTGYDKNLNSLVTSNYDRLSLQSNVNYKPIPNLELQTRILYTQNHIIDSGLESNLAYGSTGSNPRITYPYARLADEEGNHLSPVNFRRNSHVDNLANIPGLLDWHYKPLDEMDQSRWSSKGNDVLLNFGLNYKINSIFNFDIKYQYQNSIVDGNDLYRADSYISRDLINRYTNPANFSRSIPLGAIYNPLVSSFNAQTLRGQLNINKSWNKHEFNSLIGAEGKKNQNETRIDRYFGYDEGTRQFVFVDIKDTDKPLYFGGTSAIPYPGAMGQMANRFTSLFANGSYSYDKRYILSASIRKDASNVFGTKTNKRGTPLWSAGLAWNISNEKFYKSEILPYLKVRITYGFSGNVNSSVTDYAVGSYNPPNPITGLPFLLTGNPPNPSLRWEKVGIVNYGIDFSSKNNRLSGSVEYYDKRGVDLISSAPVDPTTGFMQLTFNTANIHGKGIDLTLNSKNINAVDFQWNTSFLFSYNRTKVTKYLLPRTNSSSVINVSNFLNPIEGKDAYAVFAYKWGGLDPVNGDPQGYLNGEISKDYTNLLKVAVKDLEYFGSSVPVYFGALRNELNYKRITISANLTYKLGYYFRREGLNYTNLFFSNYAPAEYANRWQVPGDEKKTNVPSSIYPVNPDRDAFYEQSATVIEKGDHVRLQNITASYTFPKFKSIQNLRFYANVNNIGIIWRANHQKLDPEYGTGLPPSRSLSFGLTANF